MKIKEGALNFRIKTNLKRFKFGGFNKKRLGLPCKIIDGPYIDKSVTVEFMCPIYDRTNRFHMMLYELEPI